MGEVTTSSLLVSYSFFGSVVGLFSPFVVGFTVLFFVFNVVYRLLTRDDYRDDYIDVLDVEDADISIGREINKEMSDKYEQLW